MNADTELQLLSRASLSAVPMPQINFGQRSPIPQFRDINYQPYTINLSTTNNDQQKNHSQININNTKSIDIVKKRKQKEKEQRRNRIKRERRKAEREKKQNKIDNIKKNVVSDIDKAVILPRSYSHLKSPKDMIKQFNMQNATEIFTERILPIHLLKNGQEELQLILLKSMSIIVSLFIIYTYCSNIIYFIVLNECKHIIDQRNNEENKHNP